MLSEKPWNLEKLAVVLIGSFFFVSLTMLAHTGLEHFLGKARMAEGTLPYLVVATLGMHGSILFGIAVALGLHRHGWSETFGFDMPPIGRALLLGLMAAIIFLPVGMVLQDVSLKALEKLHFSTEPQKAIVELKKADSWAIRGYLIFFAVVLAPVTEEMFFRGALYPAIKQLGYPRLALWLTSLMFATVHLAAGIFLPLVVLSLVLIWLYEKTDNLLAPITAHAVFNSINVILMYFGDALTDGWQRLFHH